ncbi:MAG: hypothetical protein P8129_03930 [Anaerolineae bacterium]
MPYNDLQVGRQAFCKQPSFGQRGEKTGMTLIPEESDGDEMGLELQENRPIIVDKDGVLVVRAEPLTELDHVVRRHRDQVAEKSRAEGVHNKPQPMHHSVVFQEEPNVRGHVPDEPPDDDG